jgi:hypothetical protein
MELPEAQLSRPVVERGGELDVTGEKLVFGESWGALNNSGGRE